MAPADDRAVDALLMFRPHVQEARSLRRAQPLVAIARVEVRAERLEVERHVARGVCAVDDGREARVARTAHDLLDRQQQAGCGGDVRGVHDARPLGLAREELLDDVADRQRHLRSDVARARARADRLPRHVARAVLEARREHLVARLEVERSGCDVHPRGRVLDEREVVRAAPR